VTRRRIAFAFLVGLLAAAFALAGCGGSSDDSDEGAATTTAPAAAGNDRLSEESWAEFTAMRTKAKSVNTAAVTTFEKCSAAADRGATAEQIQACLGDTLTTVVTGGKKVLATLQGFKDEAAGACAAKLTTLEGNTKLYVAGVNTLDTTLQGGGVGAGIGVQSQIDQARTALVRAQAAVPPVEAACKPV
jgi:hypothetical protein